ncbi:galactose mutarotase-like domain-containing protein [Cubamyces menziesii]|nr:galactose mutarotase-like domain-containing protein [Cubamyces menziesii]
MSAGGAAGCRPTSISEPLLKTLFDTHQHRNPSLQQPAAKHQLILDCFNSKLYHLYNYPVTSKAVKDGQGVVDVPPCAIGVCALLRTYKRRIAGGTLALDFDLPKLVYDQSREEYQVKISIRSFSSPTIPAGCPATGSFKVDLVRKKFFQGEHTDFQSPAYMVMHILDFQNAERRLAQFQSDHHNISKNMLKDILHEYAQSLHEGGISTLLAQACPSFGMNGHKPPVPGSPSTDIAWQIIIEKLQGRKEENTVEVFNGRRIRLTFSGPPIVSYAPRAGNTYFNFKFAGFAPTDGSKGSASFSVSFTVGGSASYENQGVLNTERINIDYTRPSCNRPDGMLEEPWLSDVILTIRDEYIPFLWGYPVLCHMTPVDTSTAQATVGDINKGLTNHKNLESSDISLLVFGNGDGGGGPLPKMLENLRRIRATGNRSRDIPPVNMGHSVDDFFDVIAKDSAAGTELPNWSGELYLEFHRGTYTSHGSIKKGNRKSEILLRDVEVLATFASLYRYHKTDYVYPNERINDCWEKVLLNQFHDVLPGSAIGMVYDDAEKLYAEVSKEGEALIEEAFKAIFPPSTSLADPNIKTKKSGTLVGFNTTFFPRRDIVEVPLVGSASKLRSQVVQASKDGTVGLALMDCTAGGGVAFGTGMYADCKPVSVTTVILVARMGEDHFVLKNSAVQMTIAGGRITSLFDVALDRELIPEGETGGLVIFDDRPNYWDAWGPPPEKAKKLQFAKVSVAAEGPLRASLKAEVKYGQSTINVLCGYSSSIIAGKISLDAIPASLKKGSRSFFRFDAQVDWHQRHEFLKFWHVQRPTHKNTTWDIAKFEVCGHKYADLSEFGYGVAILSESKYGFSCRGNVLRISLLRAATAPDAEQDQGKHEFSWAVLPHQGHFLESNVPIAGILFNSPLHVRLLDDTTEAPLLKAKPGFSIEGAHNVFLETVKRGLNDDFTTHDAAAPTIVLRLYEAYGGHAQVQLKIASQIPVAKAVVTNLLEDELEELNVYQTEDASLAVKLKFHGFEVKTVKLVLGKPGTQPKRDSWVTVEKPRA